MFVRLLSGSLGSGRNLTGSFYFLPKNSTPYYPMEMNSRF
nr:MAG TPA: hypothetical protein [Caudoviricetes sp.]